MWARMKMITETEKKAFRSAETNKRKAKKRTSVEREEKAREGIRETSASGVEKEAQTRDSK